MKSSGIVTITTEKIQELIKNIMAGYEQYITEKGYTDPDQFDEYLMEYLQTDEAKKNNFRLDVRSYAGRSED